LDKWFDRYYVPFESVARKILRNPEDVADVLMEAFNGVTKVREVSTRERELERWISYLTYHRVSREYDSSKTGVADVIRTRPYLSRIPTYAR